MIFYGTRHYGKMWATGSQYLSTKFFYLQFIPLIPTGSEFVLEENGSNYRSIPMGLNFKSMMLGYFRVWAFLAAFGAIIAGLDEHGQTKYLAIGAGIGIGVLWLLSMIFGGKLSEKEHAQCELLLSLTGIGCLPERLPRDATTNIWQNMAAQLVTAGVEVSPSAWSARQPKSDEPGLPILCAYALYGAALEPGEHWDALADKFWTAFEKASPEDMKRSMEALEEKEEPAAATPAEEPVPAAE